MRYLFRPGEDTPFAYTRGRRDFFLVSDDTLWAHESHDWLVAAQTGSLLAHRTGDRYYNAVDGHCLYRITSDPFPQPELQASASSKPPRLARPRNRVANTRQ